MLYIVLIFVMAVVTGSTGLLAVGGVALVIWAIVKISADWPRGTGKTRPKAEQQPSEPLPTQAELHVKPALTLAKANQARPLANFERNATTIAHLFQGTAPDLRGFYASVSQIRVVDGLDVLGGGYRKVHTLNKTQGQYLGESEFRISDWEAGETSGRAPIMTPEEKVRSFLQLLGEYPITLGACKPTRAVTDYYPHTDIFVTAEHATFKIHTESQRGQPWEIVLNDIKWTIPSSGPAEALKILASALNPEVFESLTRKAAELKQSALKPAAR
jgi:hypothetical protein